MKESHISVIGPAYAGFSLALAFAESFKAADLKRMLEPSDAPDHLLHWCL